MSKKSNNSISASEAAELRKLIAQAAKALEAVEPEDSDEEDEDEEADEDEEEDEEDEAEKKPALSVTAKINGTKLTVTNKTINEMRAKRDELLALKKPSAKQKAKLEEIADTLFKMRRIYHKNLKARRSA